MNYENIIYSLCRIGMGAQNPAFKRQVERLRDAMKKGGATAEAEKLTKLLGSQDIIAAMQPSRIQLSKMDYAGEDLGPKVSPPLDRETGAALADIRFPNSSSQPILGNELSEAINKLISEWSHIKELSHVGLIPSRTCLIFGRPGTGKTQLSYSLADKLGLPIVIARLDGLISSFLGTTARNIATLFDFANRYRCILLLDEFDAIAKLRDDPHEVGEIKRVVNTLLQNLDKRAEIGFTIGVTNHELLLDPAIWRRFEIRIKVPSPDLIQRNEIFNKYLSPITLDPPQIKFLSWITEGFTGASIETMCKSLKKQMVLEKSSHVDLMRGIKNHALIHAGDQEGNKLSIIQSEPREVARFLMKNEEHIFSQADLAQLFNCDQSTISRWSKENAA